MYPGFGAAGAHQKLRSLPGVQLSEAGVALAVFAHAAPADLPSCKAAAWRRGASA